MHTGREQVSRQAPGYLHIPGEVENVMLARWLRLLLRPLPRQGAPFRSLPRRLRRQQEQLVAALRVSPRHRGQLQALRPAPLRRGGAPRAAAAAAAAAQVHGVGLRAGRGDSEAELRQEEQQRRRRPQEPELPHGSLPRERFGAGNPD
uniref:Uncharacterized protein n=1 Tax=Mustela putorius furo TaxID=9669 RepID=M3Y9B8_MUSPF